jgi:hypothetical protein
VIHRAGGGTTLLLSFRKDKQVELVSQQQPDVILSLLGKARTLNYDGVQQELQVENIPAGILASFCPSVDYWLGTEDQAADSEHCEHDTVDSGRSNQWAASESDLCRIAWSFWYC